MTARRWLVVWSNLQAARELLEGLGWVVLALGYEPSVIEAPPRSAPHECVGPIQRVEGFVEALLDKQRGGEALIEEGLVGALLEGRSNTAMGAGKVAAVGRDLGRHEDCLDVVGLDAEDRVEERGAPLDAARFDRKSGVGPAKHRFGGGVHRRKIGRYGLLEEQPVVGLSGTWVGFGAVVFHCGPQGFAPLRRPKDGDGGHCKDVQALR